MKEFIEKLIGRLEEYKTKTYVSGITNNPCEFGACRAMDSAIKIANELAEEYKGGCCEWRKQCGFYLHKTSCGAEDTYDYSYKFCPYCGKKIKVVEWKENKQ